MPLISELYAFIAEENGPDDEGIVAVFMAGTLMPLVAADMARVNDLKSYAAMASKITGKKITLAHFIVREDLEVIE